MAHIFDINTHKIEFSFLQMQFTSGKDDGSTYNIFVKTESALHELKVP